ncbi:hypothetical protein ILUMI_00770 [Ignelater luminosus]|uniref:Tc1-like transposase DDE domain-containing protein n=1 Tax=Ignelater luminosus TaxID=2038154 RepID=A0A8K0GI32_IGNLU|nr:hypothetical protein ILUMI_00770 [Ignelater luminosus]
MLKDYVNGAPPYLNNFVTGDETCLYYYDVRSRRKNQKSIRKKMILVFLTVGILTRIVLESQRTVTASCYITECLTQVVKQLKKLRPRSGMDTWYFHHDNARPHAARLMQGFLENAGLKLLAQPPYSPDLAPCDFGLFPLVKDKLKGRKFRTDEELLAAWDQACAELPESKWQDIFNDQ